MTVEEPPRPPWKPWTAPAALLLGVFGALLFGSLVYVVVAIVTGHARNSAGGNIAATVLGDIAFVGAAVFFAQLAARPTLAQFGLRPARLKASIGWMALGYVAFLTFGGLWLYLLGIDAKDTSLDDLDNTTAAVVASAILVTVVAPVAEELLFRGYIFTALRNGMNVWGAAAVTGLLFGAIHLDPDRPIGFLVPLAFFGFVLCLVYWRTGSLLPCIALHSINNALAFVNAEGWPWWSALLLAGGALAVLALAVVRLRLLTPRPPSPTLSPA